VVDDRDDVSTGDVAVWNALRLSARIACTDEDYERLRGAVASLRDWERFSLSVEAHGLTPLVNHHFAQATITPPLAARQQLVGLGIHHREAIRVRLGALDEILESFERASIRVVILKGAALAHMLYPSVVLRPFSDIDLLVERAAAGRAQSALSSLGFHEPQAPQSRGTPRGHHHLPVMTKTYDGHPVPIEIHIDALSRDSGVSLSMDHLGAPPQPLTINARRAWTLGHVDMLHHLARQAAESATLFRLMWVADIVGYAARYHDVIDWSDVRRRYPFVINALSLLHLVTPLPPSLRDHVAPTRDAHLRGVGISSKPLSEIIKRNRPLRSMARDLFDPSDWWLRLHYGLDDRAWLWWHRGVTHPLGVTQWLVRRAATRGSFRPAVAADLN
jgi:hypothetical protein